MFFELVEAASRGTARSALPTTGLILLPPPPPPRSPLLSRCPSCRVRVFRWLVGPVPSPTRNTRPSRELDFGGHVLRHSEAADAPALHPPGCALRAYGCRACRVSVNATAARAATIPAGRGSGSDSGSGGKGDCVTPSVPPVVEKGPRAVGSCYSYEAAATAAAAAAAAAVVVSAEGDVTSTTPCSSSSSSSDEGTTSAGDGGHRSATVSYSYEAAAAAAAEATGAATTADMATNELGQDVEEKEGAVEELEQSRARDHDNPGMCPWYRIQCKSCEQEVRLYVFSFRVGAVIDRSIQSLCNFIVVSCRRDAPFHPHRSKHSSSSDGGRHSIFTRRVEERLPNVSRRTFHPTITVDAGGRCAQRRWAGGNGTTESTSARSGGGRTYW